MQGMIELKGRLETFDRGRDIASQAAYEVLKCAAAKVLVGGEQLVYLQPGEYGRGHVLLSSNSMAEPGSYRNAAHLFSQPFYPVEHEVQGLPFYHYMGCNSAEDLATERRREADRERKVRQGLFLDCHVN
jgi:hypothetical protein